MKLRPVPPTPTFVRARKSTLRHPDTSLTSPADGGHGQRTASSGSTALTGRDHDRLSQQEVDTHLSAIIASAKACTTRTLLRLPAVCKKMGCGRSTAWKYVRDALLPPPLYLGRSACWLESDLEAVIAARRIESLADFEIDMKAFLAALVTQTGTEMGDRHDH